MTRRGNVNVQSAAMSPLRLLSGLITLEEGTITEGLIWFRVESYHVVAADGKIFWLSAAPT